jgi:hypothetical protein
MPPFSWVHNTGLYIILSQISVPLQKTELFFAVLKHAYYCNRAEKIFAKTAHKTIKNYYSVTLKPFSSNN